VGPPCLVASGVWLLETAKSRGIIHGYALRQRALFQFDTKDYSADGQVFLEYGFGGTCVSHSCPAQPDLSLPLVIEYSPAGLGKAEAIDEIAVRHGFATTTIGCGHC
jgi:hypothetical protein